jgi:hypothetical protein
MTTPIRSAPTILVQTASVWGTWTTRPEIEALDASEGAGQVVGTATLTRNLGSVIPADGNTAITVTALDLVGQFVRLVIEAAGGDLTISYTSQAGNARSLTGFALWHGVCTATSTVDQGSKQGVQNIACLGLASILGQLVLSDGLAVRVDAPGSGAGNLYDLHRLPAFNRRNGSDRSAAVAVVNGTAGTAYVHDLEGTVTSYWNARQILDLVLLKWANGGTFPTFAASGALSWALSDPDGCLDYIVTDLNLDRASILDCINTLANARRGLTWRLSVSGNVATIVVSSISAAAIGDLPAAPSPAVVTATSVWIDSVAITTDASATYDIIEVVGDRPWIGLTLGYEISPTTPADVALTAGWDGEFTTNPVNSATIRDPQWFSRFQLRGDWLGNNHDGSTGLRHSLTVAGDGSMSGARAYSSTVTAQPQSLELTRELPCAELFRDDPETYPRQLPVVVVKSGSYTENLSVPADITARGIGVSVENEPPAVRVGSGEQDQGYIASWIVGAGDQLLVTVGLREAAPLRLRWKRSGSGPRDVPRVLSVPMPEFQYHAVKANTVTGVNDAGTALVTLTADLVVRDDTVRAQQTLDLLVAYYSVPAVTATWRERGTIERGTTLVPGRYVTSITLGDGVATESVAIGAVLTRRAWVFSPLDQVGTIYSTERVIPDIEAVR